MSEVISRDSDIKPVNDTPTNQHGITIDHIADNSENNIIQHPQDNSI